MAVYACPVCGRAVDADGEPFADADRVLAHVEDADDAAHAGFEAEPLREATERLATVQFGDERLPPGAAVGALDRDIRKLRTKFDRVVQEQRNDAERMGEVLERHAMAIKEMQAGLEALAEEHDKDVEFQFELP